MLKLLIRLFTFISLLLVVISCQQNAPHKNQSLIDTASLEKYLDSISKSDFDSITNKALNDIKAHRIDTSEFDAKSLNQRFKLITCEICGYKGVLPDSGYCFHCNNSVFDSTIYKMADKKIWLKNEQLNWFEVYSKNDKIDFYHPTIESGFIKDIHWIPLVTEKEIRAFSKTH